MTIDFGTRRVAQFRLTGLRAVPGIGFSRLQFVLEVNLAGVPGAPVTLQHLNADVAAGAPGSGQRVLGKATPQNSWLASTLDHPHQVPVWMELDLAGEQIEALERLRMGGPLHFQFHLNLQVRQGDQVEPVSEVLRLEVEIGQWATVLRDIGYVDLLIFALELPIDAPEEFKNAVAQLRRAHQEVLAGHYDTAVGRCRKIMDSVGALAPDEAANGQIWARAAKRPERDAMSKAERAELVRMAVRHYTHLDHHVDEKGAPEVFSRRDALSILTVAAGVIWETIAQSPQR